MYAAVILSLCFDSPEMAGGELWRFISIMTGFGWRVAQSIDARPAENGGHNVTIRFTLVNGGPVSTLPSAPVNCLIEAANRNGVGVQGIMLAK